MQAEALFDEPDTLGVAEVSRRIERAVNLALPGEVWVRGEIQNLKRHSSGHVYFDLCGDGCTLHVTLFASNKHGVNHALKQAGGGVRMTDGTEVRIRAEIRWFGQRGEVTLRMLAIDPAFTLGRLAEARDQLLRQLAADGLLRAQARLELAPVPLRVGLVTSIESAAHSDVLKVFAGSRLGFTIVECDARVQGVDASASITAALRAVVAAGVDVICLVRGGGARTDLAAFDSEAIARAIALSPVPVLTGIGHEVDTSVADEVAFARHTTPTACAAAVVERVQVFCQRRDAVWDGCLRAATTAAGRATSRLERSSGRVAGLARQHVRAAEGRTGVAAGRLARRPSAAIDGAARTLDLHRARLDALDPRRVLARGWSITRTADGRLVRTPADVAAGDALVTTTAGGDLHSRVEEGES